MGLSKGHLPLALAGGTQGELQTCPSCPKQAPGVEGPRGGQHPLWGCWCQGDAEVAELPWGREGPHEVEEARPCTPQPRILLAQPQRARAG